MAIDRAAFAEECVRQAVRRGAHPHYMIGVAQLRSNINDDSQNNELGPFRFAQADWNANCNNSAYGLNFTPTDVNSWLRQCTVFAVMARRAFDAFV